VPNRRKIPVGLGLPVKNPNLPTQPIKAGNALPDPLQNLPRPDVHEPRLPLIPSPDLRHNPGGLPHLLKSHPALPKAMDKARHLPRDVAHAATRLAQPHKAHRADRRLNPNRIHGYCERGEADGRRGDHR
jgi:hypothetical protein